MNKDKVIAWVVGSVMVLTLIGLGVWFYIASRSEPKTAVKATTRQNTSNAGSSLLEVGENTGIGGGLKAEGQGEEIPETKTNSNTEQRVDPTKFAEYDQYKDNKSALFGELKFGSGTEALANKQVAIAYKGWLTSGKLFDQSRTDQAGKVEPLVISLGAGKVIPGLEQGVLGMKVGGKRLVVVPPAAGYGATGKDPIPPNAVLVFEVELLQVQ